MERGKKAAPLAALISHFQELLRMNPSPTPAGSLRTGKEAAQASVGSDSDEAGVHQRPAPLEQLWVPLIRSLLCSPGGLCAQGTPESKEEPCTCSLDELGN